MGFDRRRVDGIDPCLVGALGFPSKEKAGGHENSTALVRPS